MKQFKHLTVHDFSFQNTTERNLSLEDVFQRVLRFITVDPYGEFRFMIGTDSHVYRKHTTFVTGIVIQRLGKGVWACYRKQKESGQMDLRQKITKETELTQHVASYFDEAKEQEMITLLSAGSHLIRECHLDIGLGKKNKTSIFVDEMMKVIEATGYQARIKPHSFVASHYANYYTKLG
ncbi:ribonuclease H-like YkuK family protein [Ammoniphilus sp. YIM 78166]|uniref:ribonuclease H-like YkuK family protein n=1 Tax=Ammoniphilus sp. YIM 78166 TaxID=1644106 RepID=UPI00106F259E|nr:ribonuclease H-like YkuK family protein [Ammoniphilus sp. YIM 78166]